MTKSLFTKLSIFILLLSLNSSCKLFKSKNKKSKTTTSQSTTKDSSKLAQITNKDSSLTTENDKLLFEKNKALLEQKVDCQTWTTKAKIHYEGEGKNYDFTANIRMQKDKLIWVSINIAGIVQVARAIISPDSFKAILYTERTAFIGPISKAAAFIPEGLDFYALQNVLLGNPINTQQAHHKASEDAQFWSFSLGNPDFLELLEYNKSDSRLNNSLLISKNGQEKQSFSQNFNNYKMIENIIFSNSRILNIETKEGHYHVEMEHSNVHFNEALSFPFSIPSSYTLK